MKGFVQSQSDCYVNFELRHDAQQKRRICLPIVATPKSLEYRGLESLNLPRVQLGLRINVRCVAAYQCSTSERIFGNCTDGNVGKTDYSA